MHSWRNEFAISPSKDNPFLHDFYREYFGKSPKSRIVPVSPPKKLTTLEPPNLSATLQRKSTRMPKESYAISLQGKMKETMWDDRFVVKFSKDNHKYPVPIREYFDSPKTFSASSTLRKTSPNLIRKRNTREKRSKSKASGTSWQLRSTASTEGWRTSSPVMCKLNSQKHPKMREYFL